MESLNAALRDKTRIWRQDIGKLTATSLDIADTVGKLTQVFILSSAEILAR